MPKHEIIRSDALQDLREEIARLRLQVAALLSERDDLIYRICPDLERRYHAIFGDLIVETLRGKMMVLAYRRVIERLQAAIYREENITRLEIEQKVREEQEEYEKTVHEKAEEYRKEKEQEKSREEQRERWNEEYRKKHDGKDPDPEKYKEKEPDGGTGDSDKKKEDREKAFDQSKDRMNDRGRKGPDEEDPDDQEPEPQSFDQELKQLYRKLVKRLHPDSNPNQTTREKELFIEVQKAFKQGDLERLRQIWDELQGFAEAVEEDEDDIEKLTKIRDELLKKREELAAEIREIKSREPYTYKRILDDPEVVELSKEQFEKLIAEYQKQADELKVHIEQLTAELEALQKRKRRE